MSITCAPTAKQKILWCLWDIKPQLESVNVLGKGWRGTPRWCSNILSIYVGQHGGQPSACDIPYHYAHFSQILYCLYQEWHTPGIPLPLFLYCFGQLEYYRGSLLARGNRNTQTTVYVETVKTEKLKCLSVAVYINSVQIQWQFHHYEVQFMTALMRGEDAVDFLGSLFKQCLTRWLHTPSPLPVLFLEVMLHECVCS